MDKPVRKHNYPATRQTRNDTGTHHNYPDTRVLRVLEPNARGEIMSSPKRTRMQNMQLKLAGYAPPHSYIYTITYNKTRAKRYQYTDVFCINNNRLFKITKIVAYILGFKLYKSKTVFWGTDAMVVRTFREYQTYSKQDMVDIETAFIKILAKKMYNDENAYVHEAIVMMQSEYKHKVEEVVAHTKKSYIVARPNKD